MPAIVIVGGQWGDEGKGKIVDLLAENADIVGRFSGGNNAGHTVVNQFGNFKLHLVPSGIFYPQVKCIIGSGVVINPAALIQEISDLEKRGINVSGILISDRAHLVMPYHIMLDGLEEDARGNRALGTTRRGIGPAYTDKIARMGIRTGDLVDKSMFGKRLRLILDHKNNVITKVFNADPLSFDDIYEEYCSYSERLKPFLCETSRMVDDALERGEKVILEGSQGTMLDIDYGTYPYVTSSPPTSWGASLGMGISPKRIDRILGIVKAYTTRVGSGPMPTEIHCEDGDRMREAGREYGTTTGRPRRCGWFDGVAVRFSARLNGFTDMALTKFDILDSFASIKVCTGYELDGEVIDSPPANLGLLERCKPVYEEMAGWQTCTADIRELSALPKQARRYVERIEELAGCSVSLVSVGCNREQSIIQQDLFVYE